MLIDLYAHGSIIMQIDIVANQSRSIDDAQLEIDQRCYKTMTMVGYDNYAAVTFALFHHWHLFITIPTLNEP